GLSLTGAQASNYTVNTTATAPADITQLASVAWVGGSGNLWSTAANWAGGAIPDLANVANVTVPTGATVVFDNTVQTGAVQLTSLTVSPTSSLTVNSGTMSVANALNTYGYAQTGGVVTAASFNA